MSTPSRSAHPRLRSTDQHRSPCGLILFLTSTLLVSAILTGCTGVTSAKGNSTAAAINSTSATPNSVPSTALSASPATVSFGNVSEGSTSNQSLTITNSGTSSVTISQASASGAGFSIGGVALPVSLNPGTSATFTASFAPTSPGGVSGSASFTGPQLSSAFVVQMTATGVATAPSITMQPANASIVAGQTATFSVGASGTAPLSYQWRKNGTAIAGATSFSYTTPAETTSDNGAQFSVAVSNSAGSLTSNIATLTVTVSPVAPSITTQPSNQTVFAGQKATFSVIANGTSPLSYQWRKNGTVISGATSASYTTPAETTSDSGALFSVVVSNSVGNVTSNSATLTVNPDPAPAITSQPASQTITAGQTATFSVTASGTAPLSYQWQKNGVAISGATSSSYTTPAETTSDNGAQFAVVVSNSAGTATSNSAVLTVNPAPVAPSITTQPSSKTITAGQTATFSVGASGTAPLNYQWQKNGTAISGAISSSYTTSAETTADSGAQFTVIVSNSVGSITSNAATLTVNAPTPGALTPSTTSLSFGNVIITKNSSLSVNFTNSGSVNITVATVTIFGGYTASGISNGQIITPGQVVTLNVTFAPAATGSVPGSVTIASNASNSPAVVALSGTGVLAHTATLNWTASTSTVIGYNVYRGTVSGGPYTLVNPSIVAGTQYVDSTALAGQTYYYVATAVASGNVESSYSNQVVGSVPIP
jgi:Abnormal spindle-like microcephaly-assoc'd, ASPM-SPD-2-Hydin/Immunoglobulin domain/Immunoglobulin I-set domain